jgi:FKBP-type peptidyl-prolyl cis-trans isomerase SlpA
MTEELTIQPGSEVTMHCSITLEDGTVAESTLKDEPLHFTLGDGTLIQGLELAIYGLKAGDKQSLKIDPEYAFGPRDDEGIRVQPRSDFPEDMNLEVGQIIEFETHTGEFILGAVMELEEDNVTMDFNHPLAGHEIQFDVEILDVKPPEAGSGVSS